MALFTYDDIVRVREDVSPEKRPGARAWIIAVFPDSRSRPGDAFQLFPDGAIYSVEFEDGVTVDLHESSLENDA